MARPRSLSLSLALGPTKDAHIRQKIGLARNPQASPTQLAAQPYEAANKPGSGQPQARLGFA
ncbi:hypothetical protein AMTR_s00009p00224490 [Amborella trichopoda]|uniref:Uncharacterized protein n=1 Tax=Amborella trichopoda TaxID=13333 RepID=W1NII1_AMBTC|nr:hypothetical protein AMTR_s00009p00224490 [Amborella trichopoda]